MLSHKRNKKRGPTQRTNGVLAGASASGRQKTNGHSSRGERKPLGIQDYLRPPHRNELELARLREQNKTLAASVDHLARLREHYARLFQAAPVGYMVMDFYGTVHECNLKLPELLRHKPGEPFEGPFVRFVCPGYVRAFLNHLHDCRAGGGPIRTELELRAGSGESLPVALLSVASVPGAKPSPKLIRTVVLDTSSSSAARDALAQKERDFETLVNSLQGIVWEADARTLAVEFISRQAETILGFRLDQWHQPTFWESHIHVDDRERFLAEVARALSERSSRQIEYRLLAADRRAIWVHDNLTVRERGGQLKVFGVAVDITDRRLAEERLQMAHQGLEQRVRERTMRLRETVAELEAFSYSLSHDMRAPLRAMQGYSQLLLSLTGRKLGRKGRVFLERIMSSTERLDHLIQDVLQYSRVARSPVELAPIDLERLIRQVISDYPTLASPEVEIEVQSPLVRVLGHEAFLSQCVSNLLTNAVKFSQPGERSRVRVSTRPFEGDVRLWIEDSGIGIAPEDQQRIFGIFQRVHSGGSYEGTGIGLAIVAKAAERMGGRVGVESALGQGSRFWLQLQPAAS